MRFDELEDTAVNVDIVRDAIWSEVARLYGLAREVNGMRRRPAELGSRI